MTTVRRAVGFTVGTLLLGAGLAAVPGAPASAAEPDPTPIENGATWLAAQLTDGLSVGEFGPDHGLTIDIALALADAGDTETVDLIADAMAAQVDADNPEYNYVSGEAFGDAGSSYAGAVAKTVVLAQVAGEDPTTYAGEDFVARLESTVLTEGASAGRIHDISAFGDYTNALGQAFAVRALDTAGSDLAESATEYLQAQQCAGGFYRLAVPAQDAEAPACPAGAAPSIDATATVVLNLLPQADDTDVAATIDAAVAWLESVQDDAGGFGSDADIPAANANSTGLAGWALGEAGETDPAAAAAVWLRQHQADDFGPCTTGLTAELGAVLYDDTALANGRSEGMDGAGLRSQTVRSTAQALPALAYAPAGTYPDLEPVAGPFVRAGSLQDFTVPGVAPGQTVCFARGASQALVNADLDGVATGQVRMPAGSANRVYTAAVADRTLGTITFRVLDAKTLPVERKKRVAAGKNQVVTVKGLAVGEKVKVVYKGRTVGTGFANANGKKTFRFPAGAKTGKQTFRVVGQFGDRKATKAFTVK